MNTRIAQLFTVVIIVTATTLLLTSVLVQAASSTILINAVYYDTYISYEPEEAFQLINVSAGSVDLTNWTVTDFQGVITLTNSLAAGESIWIAREADDFYLEFGFKPDYEYQSNTDPTVPDLPRFGTFALSNDGDKIALRDDSVTLIDAVV